MIISRREWEEKCDNNRALLKDKEEKLELIEKMQNNIKDLEMNLELLKTDIEHKENMNKILNERLISFEKNNNIINDNNQKLIDWINKIINEVGIYEVEDRHSVVIPIYKNPVKTYSGKLENLKEQLPEFMNQEEIIIPEIRFVKMK